MAGTIRDMSFNIKCLCFQSTYHFPQVSGMRTLGTPIELTFKTLCSILIVHVSVMSAERSEV